MSASAMIVSAELAESLAKPLDFSRALCELRIGLHPGVPEEVYHARVLGFASKSALDLVARSPAHYKAWIDGVAERPTTRALSFGKACHLAILEPEAFARRYVIAPDFGPQRKTDECSSERAKENKKRRQAWLAEHAGATILESKDDVAMLGMVRSILEHPIARPLLEDGVAELTARWDDEATGLACKSRIDFYGEALALLVDLKSTMNASLDAFRRDVWKYAYHRQDAFYRDGLEVLGAPVGVFTFIAVEKDPPHALGVYSLDASAVAQGRRENRLLLEQLSECVARGVFPGYPERIVNVELPAWARERE
jgi:hypothetical protein